MENSVGTPAQTSRPATPFKIGNVRATIYGNVNNVYDYNYIMDAQCAAADEGIWQNVYAVMYSFGRTYTVRLKINF